MEERAVIRVVMADDHPPVREGIRAILDRAEDIQVVGEADDGQKAIELVNQLKPNVLVIDIAMPNLNGIEAALQLKEHNLLVSIVILSMHSDPMLVRRAFRSGVKGYVSKQSVSDELLLAVRSAYEGKIFLSPSISNELLGDYLTTYSKDEKASSIEQLSGREQEILKLIALGNTNNEIADNLHLSAKTVEKHRTSLMTKLDIHDIAGLVRLAIKYKLILLDDE